MEITITQVDAFTHKPFAGNPAAVCVTSEPLSNELMQAIALEMNLSETAFLYPIAGGYHLRWFTPHIEVDLCGHATLASAHVLWSEGHLANGETARFNTRSGWLSATQQDGWIAMNFPLQPVHTAQAIPALIKALFSQENGNQDSGNQENIRAVAKNDTNYLIELCSEQALRDLQPDFSAMSQLPVQGVIATAKAEREPVDFVSRYFAPVVGINEDPVTGSAHASLTPYWQAKLGKSAMLAHQVSARGGVIRVEIISAAEIAPGEAAGKTTTEDRVSISGQAVTLMQGTLFVANYQ
ncbi:MAG: PhzF family phenazine biosynthesis protein [Phormidesmis sp. RL_2_1]|nr:PhzF family phenazine biosynthesis protein [Phormidesmis sp. RL_2_1]